MHLFGCRAVTLASVAAASMAVAGCGGAATGSRASAGRNATAATLARAAGASDSARGYKFRLSILETVAGAGAAQIAGSGTYSAVDHSVAMTMSTTSGSQSSQIQEIVLGPIVYVKELGAVAAKLPGDKPWLELDLSKVGKHSYLSDLSSLMNSSSETNPADVIGYLEAESTHVTNLGSAIVAGVPTTHYRANIDLEKAGSGLPSSVHKSDQDLLSKLPGTVLNKTDIPADVWIDATHLVRKMTMMMRVIPKGTSETVTTALTLRMTEYGPQPALAPPPASETLNLLALLKREGKAGALSNG